MINIQDIVPFMKDGWVAMDECGAQLKELLKDCKDIFDECFSPSVKYGELYKNIDEALK